MRTTAGLAEIAAMLLALAVLQVARSRLTPCLSAAVFPVLFGIHGWVFMVAATANRRGDSHWMVTNRRSAALLPVASPCPGEAGDSGVMLAVLRRSTQAVTPAAAESLPQAP